MANVFKIADVMKGLCSMTFNKWFLVGCLFLWILFQFFLIYFGNYSDLVSDPGLYVYYATECVNNGTMYPDYSNYHDEYIFNPGYINFLILWIKLFGSVKLVPYFNIVLNMVIVWLIYTIGKQLTSKKGAYLAVYCFLLIPAYTTIVLHLYTEQLFAVLILFSLLPFVSTGKKEMCFVLSGGLIALAQWVRPVAMAWMVPCLLLLLWRKEFKKCAMYVVTYTVTCLFIAVATHQNFPNYLYKASTGGVNMIMGANDMADGTYCGAARKDKNGLGYLEDVVDGSRVTNVKAYVNDTTYIKRRNTRYSYNQFDSIYISRSLGWIKDNPVKWGKLSFKKIYWTFCYVPSFMYSYGGDLLIPYKFYMRVYKYSNEFYFIVIVMSAFMMLLSYKKFLFLFVLPILCYLFTIILTCGAPRYSMPLIPFFCILAGQFVKGLMDSAANIWFKRCKSLHT